MRYASISDPTILIGYATHPGKTGKNNEDDFALFEADLTDGVPPRPLATMQVALVADGIGGNMAGETASHLTAQTFYDTFRLLAQTPARRRLLDAIETANQVVYARALEDPNLKGMGTTVVAAALLGNELFVAHAGDSRAYLVREGRAFQLTADHTWAQEAIEAGRLTPDQARAHPNRHVIKRFLGIAPDVEVDTDVLEVTASPPNPDQMHLLRKLESIRSQLGDVILLCSDGLTDVVSDKQIEQTLKHYGVQLQDAANHLVELANKAGGPDNITVLILQRRDPAAPLAAARGPSRQTPLLGLLLAGALLLVVGAGVYVFGDWFGFGATPVATDVAVLVPTTPSAALAQSVTVQPPTLAPTETLSSTVGNVATPAPVATATASATAEPPFTLTPVPTSTAVSSDTVGTPSAAQQADASATQITQTLTTTDTATVAATVELIPAPALTSATRPPTSTPVPELVTDTPTPTETPTATEIPPPTRLTSVPRATSSQLISVQLLSPTENDTVDGNRTFIWQPLGDLPAGYGFEPVFSTSSQDLMADGRGWGGNTAETQLPIDLTKYLPSGSYKWGVRVVQVEPYTPIKLISEERVIKVESPSGPSSGGGGGNPSGPTPSPGDPD